MSMTVSELMKAMADAGAPFEAILIAVQALDAKDAEIAARDAEQAEKKARDAERKRAERQARRIGKSTDCPRTVQGRGADTTLDKETPPTPPKEINPDSPPISPRKSKPGKPDDVSEPVWRDFCRQRDRQKAPVSDTALAGIRREATRAGWTMDAALSESVARGWRGFKAEWVAPAEQSTGPPGNYLDYVTERHRRENASP